MQNLSEFAKDVTEVPTRAALCATRSVALDTSAKLEIKRRLLEAGLTVEDERLHPTGLDGELAASSGVR